MNTFAIHAHFYQPPREDPLSGEIRIEPNASPYPNWNEKIHAECYRSNAELENFKKISFNIGPTLFHWLDKFHPETSKKIIEQDHLSKIHHGSGNALAQAYNHTILPLGSFQDKVTQIYWGIADFTHRYKRAPKGMWLPETAVDEETLEVLARFGITFTILAPWQADEASLDTNHPYRIRLSENKEISIFFYQQELSGMISFSPDVTINADRFAREVLKPRFSSRHHNSREDEIILIASDGELYGHHQHRREHFLAHLTNGASASADLQPVGLESWLKDHPAREFVRIKNGTSWSCHHGIGRWTGSCACTPGDRTWKQQFRLSLDHLAKAIDEIYLHETRELIPDPWRLRDRFIHVLLGQLSFQDLLLQHNSRETTKAEDRKIYLLLEAQRERQRMFTSCGWFFEDFDRIEPYYNIAYAAQAVHLVKLAAGIDLEAPTKQDLKSIISEKTRLSAADLFEQQLHRSENSAYFPAWQRSG